MVVMMMMMKMCVHSHFWLYNMNKIHLASFVALLKGTLSIKVISLAFYI